MLSEFSFLSPKELLFGFGAVQKASAACKKLGLSKVLVVCDQFIVDSGIQKVLTDILGHEGISCEVFSKFDPSPTIAQVESAGTILHDTGCEGIIGFGGGSSLDTAKAISILKNNPAPISNYFGIDKIPNPGCPMIMVSTTAGTGSEVSDACILRDQNTQIKSGLRSKYLIADVAIADPNLTVSMPPRLTASTGMDALTHCIEGFVSNGASPMTRLYHREGIRLIAGSLRTAVGNGNNLDARYNVMLGSVYAGWAMSTASLGACHAMAYPIEGKYHVPHGDANASLLPAVMKYNALGNLDLFREIAIAMGEVTDGLTVREAAYKAVEAVTLLARDIGIPGIAAYGVTEADLHPFAEISAKNARLMGYNPRKASVEAIEGIYRDAM